MGLRLVCACLLLAAPGCATPAAPSRSEATLHQVPRGDRRLPHPSAIHARTAPTAPSLAAAQRAILATTAKRLGDGVFYVRADVPRTPGPAAVPTNGGLAGSVRNGGVGALVDRQSLVLTAAHVVRGASRVCVVGADGCAHTAAQFIVHPRLDLALLVVPTLRGDPLTPCTPEIAPGMPVVALAARNAELPSDPRFGVLLRGSVSMQQRLDPQQRCDYAGLLESTVLLEPGFSGSPLVDIDGRFVGVNLAVAGAAPHARRAYSLPFDARTLAAIDELRRQITALRPAPDPPAGRSAPIRG